MRRQAIHKCTVVGLVTSIFLLICVWNGGTMNVRVSPSVHILFLVLWHRSRRLWAPPTLTWNRSFRSHYNFFWIENELHNVLLTKWCYDLLSCDVYFWSYLSSLPPHSDDHSVQNWFLTPTSLDTNLIVLHLLSLFERRVRPYSYSRDFPPLFLRLIQYTQTPPDPPHIYSLGGWSKRF